MRKFLMAAVVAVAGALPMAAAPASAAGLTVEIGHDYHHHHHHHWRHHHHHRHCFVKREVHWHHHHKVVVSKKYCR